MKWKMFYPWPFMVFLRMNLVGECQACHFIHQNMGAVDAETKVASELDAFVKDLNVKTLAAAKDARQTQYRKFTDVLSYNPATDNTYVPGLWNGTPPMGSTSTHYFDRMQSLKTWIMHCIQQMRTKRRKNMTTLQNFTGRLNELWHAIKYENFVFSFKNVLAVEAYSKLKKEFGSRQWDLKCEVRKVIDQVETYNEHRVFVEGYKGNVTDLINECHSGVTSLVENGSEEIKGRILHYFQCPEGCQNCNKDIQNRYLLAKYEKDFEYGTDALKELLKNEVTSAMNNLELKIRGGPKNSRNK